MLGRLLATAALAGLAACSDLPPPAHDITSVRFPPANRPRGVARSNRDLAADFLDLTFELESGERLEHLLRYERPIRVYLRSEGLDAYRPDLGQLLSRLRREASLDIAETRDPDAAQIFIEAVPAAQITRIFPTAACFIVPGETSWHEFTRRRPSERLRWPDQTVLERAVIFLPLDTTPQDVRDCLNEEITQALGPANDLYRLPDSIWNDDNFHGMATPFDMTMLRTLYQPEFGSGMTRPEVAARLPSVLARTNPKGRGIASQPRAPESRAWSQAIETALARDGSRARRAEAAADAVRLAEAMRPVDHRLGVALLTRGRIEVKTDPWAAAEDFIRTYALFRQQFGRDDVRTAQAGVHLGALAIGAGEYDVAVNLADRHLSGAFAAQNAILVASLLSVKAEAQSARGDAAAARATRLDSLRWARYGFGDVDGALAREQAEITAIIGLDNPT